MFECNIDLVQSVLQKEFGEEAEFFYDIHCPDPFEIKIDFVFPVVSVHSTGLYLMLLWDEKDGEPGIKTERLDYICRVFKSYFFTKVPIRSLFLFRRLRNSNICKLLELYDCHKRDLCFGNISLDTDLVAYVEKHLQEDAHQMEDERNALIDRLSMENMKVCNYDSDDNDCFIKRGSDWAPAFKKDSDTAFNLALFGGMFGLHRFYLGRYGSGLLYFFTFGLFGAGWLVDCIEMLLGCWKSKGVFLLPLNNKRRQGIKLLVVFAMLCSIIFFIMPQLL